MIPDSGGKTVTLEFLLFDSMIGFNQGPRFPFPWTPELAPKQWGESLRKQIPVKMSLHTCCIILLVV